MLWRVLASSLLNIFKAIFCKSDQSAPNVGKNLIYHQKMFSFVVCCWKVAPDGVIIGHQELKKQANQKKEIEDTASS